MARDSAFDFKCLRVYNDCGSHAEGARLLGVPRETFRDAVYRARGAGERESGEETSDVARATMDLPDFPSDDLPPDEVVDYLCKRFDKRRASYDAHTWFTVNIKQNLPIGILWFGDPHLDDNGCNWPLLREHVTICANTDGMYGANIGDTTNNWSGRLIKLYANQDTSLKTARRLAKWFMIDSGIDWLVWLLGNHDQWGDGAAILALMGAQKIICHDWEARFQLQFSRGKTVRIFAAHDFKGHSQWNPLHGPMKAAQMGAEADLYVCGHKHHWAVTTWENAERGFTPTLIRVRGYKYMDEYARNLGITEQKEGAAILTIIDPTAETKSGTILSFTDIQAGADYLTYLRNR